jgi:hypothetical protein
VKQHQSNLPIAIGLVVFSGVVIMLVDGSSSVTATEWFSSAATILAAVIGAAIAGGVVAWQVRTQAKLSLDQAKRSEITGLKTQLYEGITDIVAKTNHPGASVYTWALSAPSDLENAAFLRRQLPDSQYVPRSRMGALSDAWMGYRTAAVEIIRVVEEWRFMDPRLEIFKTAINVAITDVDDVVQEIVQTAHKVLPFDVPTRDGGTFVHWTVPDPSTFASFSNAAQRLASAALVLGNYIDDFRYEMQRSLLGDLFDFSKVGPRRPLDPKLLVISLERSKELDEYFHSHTIWGRNKALAEERVKRQLNEVSS